MNNFHYSNLYRKLNLIFYKKIDQNCTFGQNYYLNKIKVVKNDMVKEI